MLGYAFYARAIRKMIFVRVFAGDKCAFCFAVNLGKGLRRRCVSDILESRRFKIVNRYRLFSWRRDGQAPGGKTDQRNQNNAEHKNKLRFVRFYKLFNLIKFI